MTQIVSQKDLTSSRVIFIDLLRFVAIFMMVHGHTVDVLLSYDHRLPGSVGFNTWLFFRGLTAPLFLFASGFVYGVRFRRTDSPEKFKLISRKTIRRALLIIVIGYLMKSPTPSPFHWTHVTYQMIQLFFAVDILQLIGVSLLILLGIETIARRFKFDAIKPLLGISFLFLMFHPIVKLIEWEHWLPLSLSSWFSQATGSLFPLFPWGAYLFLGGALGIYFQRKSYFTDLITLSKVQLKFGIIFIVGALGLNFFELLIFNNSSFWTISPNLVYSRFGTVLIFGSLFALVSISIKSIPQFLRNASKNSLEIYVLHVMILYGSSWNLGVKSFLGNNLNVIKTIIGVILMIGLMILFSEGLTKFNNVIYPKWKSKILSRLKKEKG
ncbi:MAG: DUF1624 domain-containing protein [Bacteroidetes bacterium]|nr:DUF1624 domain-containing protein [Bacteroidota bacterium]MBU2584155.1 DUF1624 domain-containing protein [Bacteroidota bacterium]